MVQTLGHPDILLKHFNRGEKPRGKMLEMNTFPFLSEDNRRVSLVTYPSAG